MLKLAIIIGSTRPARVGEAVAKWVHELAQKRSDAEFELVDIKDFNLPLLLSLALTLIVVKVVVQRKRRTIGEAIGYQPCARTIARRRFRGPLCHAG